MSTRQYDNYSVDKVTRSNDNCELQFTKSWFYLIIHKSKYIFGSTETVVVSRSINRKKKTNKDQFNLWIESSCCYLQLISMEKQKYQNKYIIKQSSNMLFVGGLFRFLMTFYVFFIYLTLFTMLDPTLVSISFSTQKLSIPHHRIGSFKWNI